MRTKLPIIIAGVAIVVGCVTAVTLNSKKEVAPEKTGGGTVPVAAPPGIPAAPDEFAGKIETVSEISLPPEKSNLKSQEAIPAAAAPADPPPMINGYILQDPLARIALAFVGSDPDADAYWIGAINDPAMPAEERKDLIEDLNQEGLVDPNHLTAEDVPLIASRLRLIEQLMNDTVDPVNRDALGEAYKDLVSLANGEEQR